MNITIIGASAGVGLEAVKIALQRDHHVTTLSRSEISLSGNTKLNMVKGTATNKADLSKSMANADAVIVALGTGTSTKPTTLYSDFARLLVEIQQETNIQIPFIILTGFGAGESAKYQSFFMRLIFNLFMKAVYADKTKMEEIIANSQLKWEIIRPGRLMDGALTEKYRVETTLFKGMKIRGINRADVADYLVKQAEQTTELYRYYALSNQ